MEMTEESWRSALGLSGTDGAATVTQADTGSGETEQEAAAPAEAEATETAQEAEAAEPDLSGKPKQSREENARQAKARREREQQEAIEAAVKAEREKFAEQLKAARLPDPTRRGEYLQSMEDLDGVSKARAMRNAAKAINDNGDLTADELTELLSNSESGRAMLALVAEAEAAKAEAEAQAAAQIRNAGVNEISMIDPTIKSYDDLAASEEYETFRGYVLNNGLSWADAWKLAAGERIGKHAAAAARQRTLNQLSGKAHMAAPGGNGGEGVDLPASVEAQYRALFPGMSHEQMLRKYNDYLRNTKQN